MKKVFGAAFLAFSSTMALAIPAEASSQPTFVIQSKVASGAASNRIAPLMQVTTTSTGNFNIGGTTLLYYFYEQNLPVTWSSATASPAGTTAFTQLLDRTYTGPNDPVRGQRNAGTPAASPDQLRRRDNSRPDRNGFDLVAVPVQFHPGGRRQP